MPDQTVSGSNVLDIAALLPAEGGREDDAEGEDAELDLPNRQGDEDEALGLDEDDDLVVADEADDKDDAHADDLDIGDVDVAEEGAAAKDDVGFDVDHADAPAFDDHTEQRTDEDASPEEIELDGIVEHLPATLDDGGVEGTAEGSEADLAESLPALDAGGDEELEMSELLSEVGLGEEEWEPAPELTLEGAAHAVDCADGRVASAGQVLAVLEPGEVTPRVHALAEVARHCAVTPFGVAVATAAGIGLRSSTTDAVLFQNPDVARLGVAGGRLYARVGRELFQLDARGGRAASVRADVVDFAASAGSLVALIETPRGCSLAQMRGHDGEWEELGPAGELGALVLGGGKLVVNGALAMAGVEHDGVSIRWSANRRLDHLAIDGAIDATFKGDARGAPLLVLASSGGRTRLLSVTPDGSNELVELVGPPGRAVAWDATRELVFVAGPGGIVAVRPRVRH